MEKRSKIILILFTLVFLGIIVTEIVRPKPLNWNPSYTSDDKIPYGCYVLYHELPALFPESVIQAAKETPYTMLAAKESWEHTSYLLINDHLAPDKQETNRLLKFVAEGNSVFMAASSYGQLLSDTLNITVFSGYSVRQDTVRMRLTNPSLGTRAYIMTNGTDNARFTSMDTLHSTVLGYVNFNDYDYSSAAGRRMEAPNFIQVAFGKGNFYLNCSPKAFSNYHMLSGNEGYVSGTLSYLDDGMLLWDDYLKSGRLVIDSPMRFVLTQLPLKWAYYLALSGILLFVFFRAKREQRIIPVLMPLQNTSVAFAETVGSLYYQHRDYSDIIGKKCNYFFEYLRSHFHLNTARINEQTAVELAGKSGIPVRESMELLDFIIFLKNKDAHTEQDLIKLNQYIQSFKLNTGRHAKRRYE